LPIMSQSNGNAANANGNGAVNVNVIPPTAGSNGQANATPNNVQGFSSPIPGGQLQLKLPPRAQARLANQGQPQPTAGRA
jgi:hypothetical protein